MGGLAPDGTADHPEQKHLKESKGPGGQAGPPAPGAPSHSPRLQALLQTLLAAWALQRLCFSLDFLRNMIVFISLLFFPLSPFRLSKRKIIQFLSLVS